MRKPEYTSTARMVLRQNKCDHICREDAPELPETRWTLSVKDNVLLKTYEGSEETTNRQINHRNGSQTRLRHVSSVPTDRKLRGSLRPAVCHVLMLMWLNEPWPQRICSTHTCRVGQPRSQLASPAAPRVPQRRSSELHDWPGTGSPGRQRLTNKQAETT